MISEAGKVTSIHFNEKENVAAVTLKVKNRYAGKTGPANYYLRCLCFGNAKDIVQQYGKQGTFATVVGDFLPGPEGTPRINTNSEGKVFASYDIRVHRIYFFDTKEA